MHDSTMWLIGESIIVVLVVILLGFLHHPSLFSYPLHKLLHITGGILLLGNIIVTGTWMFMAERTQNADVLRFATRTVNWADVFFTVPGIFLLITNGDILAEQWGGPLKTSWIVVSIAIFVLSGIIWISMLLRYQNKLITLSKTEAARPVPQFFTVLHRWYFWGALATVLPLISLVIMFFKPTFW